MRSIILLAALFIPLTTCSSGDLDSLFLNCLQKCKCSPNSGLFSWSCAANCKYECMWQVTNIYKSQSYPQVRPHQYYGKWPFYRLFALQEPASVFFSILNLFAHYTGYRRLTSLSPLSPMRDNYRYIAMTGMFAWICSTIFHSKDNPTTEKLDYFSAMLYLLTIDYQALAKVALAGLAVKICFAIFYILHVSYLSLYSFDYSYNMAASVTTGILSNSIWLVWCYKNWRNRSTYAWKMVVMILCLTSAMSLELMDFPPIWGVFDAHSLWHAATIPITYLFYDFLVCDVRWEFREKKGKFSL